MAITFVLVTAGPNHVVYQANAIGAAPDPAHGPEGTIQFTGAGAADVALEDAAVPPAGVHWNAGLLKELVDQAGITTTAIAERHFMDKGGIGSPTVGDGLANVNGKRMRAYVVPTIAGADVLAEWGVSADTNGAARGEYNLVCSSLGVGVTSTALVVIEALGTPLQF